VAFYRCKFEHVAGPGLSLTNGACGQFYDRMRGETSRQPPRGYAAAQLAYAMLAIEVDQVDGKPHADGVYGLAGLDPEAFSRSKLISSEQALSACGAVACEIELSGQDRIASLVENA